MSLPVLTGERLTLRPLADADLDALVEIVSSPTVREWWNPIESREGLRQELVEDPAFTIEIDGQVAGWLAVYEQRDPNYMNASHDIVLGPDFQGRGLGPEALRLAIQWLIERGHHRITIDPAVANERAIRAYASIGFRPVGAMRDYERGPDGEWHDGLLMDLLAGELR